MGAPADRLNRILLALIGLALLTGGAAMLIRSFGGFGQGSAQQALLAEPTAAFAERNEPLFWIAVAAGAVLLALLGLCWLLAQLRTDRVGQFDLEPDPQRGATVLPASAVTSALCEEVESYHGVQSASARLLHDPRWPDLVLLVDLDDRADISATRRRIETDAVSHVRQAVGVPDLPTRLIVRPGAVRPR